MIVTVASRHMEISPALKSYAEQKASKLEKYYDRILEIGVIFDAGKTGTSVEMIVKTDYNDKFIAHHDEAAQVQESQPRGDAYTCIDRCVDKLERQLTEHKEKYRNRKHNTGEDKRLKAL
jgi:putative sigma-54 modulation protein